MAREAHEPLLLVLGCVISGNCMGEKFAYFGETLSIDKIVLRNNLGSIREMPEFSL